MNHVFPRSVLFASREEFGDREDTPNARSYNPQATHPPLKLRIREGNIPADLCGHVYIVGPVGSVDSLNIYGQADQSVVVPSLDGTTLLYNGDGMIYRLDFDQPKDGVYLSSRMVKTPCYYADAATHRCPDYQGKKSSHNPRFNKDLRFRNFGITRLSSFLGIRNQLNTAFLPMRFSEEDRDRLLVSWDMGRPYEIDPRTLETITPVGREIEWKEINPLIKSPHKPEPMFKTVQSCAHPSFDPHTGEVFNVNTGRSLANFFSQLLPVNRLLKPVIRTIQNQVKNRHRELIANGNKKTDKVLWKYL
ncbi:carotenoid oxygenase family protein [Geitlerinema sp. PCC 7407]|uniref:carotenoid oxygenase family protein n=1 Tax=Geitlerinema sp. PCC 7407 TaxID=1173025 RepID=UPI00167F96D5|nr:carotenoid oxygenase family protein [Geitlerinema sp. PCC 7407]